VRNLDKRLTRLETSHPPQPIIIRVVYVDARTGEQESVGWHVVIAGGQSRVVYEEQGRDEGF
jgi:hypothetical protein